MKTAWTILLISALTDSLIAAGTSWTTFMQATKSVQMPDTAVIITILVGGVVIGARTIQQALKASMDTAATKQLTSTVPPKA